MKTHKSSDDSLLPGPNMKHKQTGFKPTLSVDRTLWCSGIQLTGTSGGAYTSLLQPHTRQFPYIPYVGLGTRFALYFTCYGMSCLPHRTLWSVHVPDTVSGETEKQRQEGMKSASLFLDFCTIPAYTVEKDTVKEFVLEL